MKDNLSAYNSNDYDSRVRSVLPYYDEFHKQAISLVEAMGFEEINWLDTGCGTGTLAQLAVNELDNIASFTLCDPSAEMLRAAVTKTESRFNYYNVSSEEMTFKEEFDVVTAIQSHHYLYSEGRKTATEHCYNALTEGGVYISFENIMFSDSKADLIGEQRWRYFLEARQKSSDEINAHLSRRNRDFFPITIEEHLSLLRECGFRTANLFWLSYLQAGFFAIK